MNQERISRRKFLKYAALAGGVGAVLSAGAIRAYPTLSAQADAYLDARADNDTFLAKYSKDLSRLNLGTSFSPEQVVYLLGERQPQLEKELRVLSVIRENLGIDKIRLGARWYYTVNEKGRFTFERYQRFFDYCLQNGVELTFNDGEIKTFRSPEDHVHPVVWEKIDHKPEKKSVIRAGSPLAEAALIHARDKLEEVNNADKVLMWQKENEAFYKAGENLWTMGEDYLTASILQVDSYYPRTKFLTNSFGLINTEQIKDFYINLLGSHPQFSGRLVSGIDYYYLLPHQIKLPQGKVLNVDNLPLDLFSLFEIANGPGSVKNVLKQTVEAGITLEATEVQLEPWKNINSPGNSAREFRFVLARFAQEVLSVVPSSQRMDFRLWGSELLAKNILENRLTKDHHEIIDLINQLNKLSKPS